MKTCTVCKEMKDVSYFGINKTQKDGFSYICKECNKLKSKKWREDNKEQHDKYVKEYNNREDIKEKNRLKSEKYREDNKEHHDRYIKEYYSRVEIKEKNRLNSIKYREDNKDKIKKQKDKWREDNKDRLKLQKKEYRRSKKETDPIYKLYQSVSSMIRKSFNYNGFKKNSRTYEILGCTFEYFKEYIEAQFETWMTWEIEVYMMDFIKLDGI